MSWMNSIIAWLKDIEQYFYDAYLKILACPWPVWEAASPFLFVSRGFGWLAYYFSLLNNWLVWVNDKITTFLTSLDLEAWFKEWKQKILDAWNWVTNAWGNVLSIIDQWWLATQSTIQSWINIATEGLNALKVAWDNFWNITFPQWTGKLDTLKAAWDNFWTVIFPSLVSFDWLGIWWSSKLKEIDTLIKDTIKTWLPFYDDLVSLWEDIKLFFADPLQWLYNKMDEWFERFW